MVDQIYDRTYQAARSQLNASIADAVALFVTAGLKPFKVLNRIEYNAPWLTEQRKTRCN